MTILPKKKHQENKKNDAEFDTEGRNRSTRARSVRERNRPPSDDLGTAQECSANTGHDPASPKYDYSDLDSRDSQDISSVPFKRTRHRPVNNNNTGIYFMGSSPAANSPRTRSNRNSDDEEEGYNSSDEHGPREADVHQEVDDPESQETNIEEKEGRFEVHIREKRGFIIKKMAQDGACMFRAVADQVYGDQEMHSCVRSHCMDYMVKNADYFSKFVTEDFTSYIRRKRNENCHGNNVEMQALSEMYNRPIEVYEYSLEPINTFTSSSGNNTDTPPIRLSYHGRVHYNSIVDPYNPTVGVGLGLAGYKPGLADRMLLNDAIGMSEEQRLEQAMLEDKLKATDWECTDETIAEVVARESYLQWLKDNQRRHTNTATNGASCSSAASSSQSRKSPPREPQTCAPSPRSSASGYSPRSPRPPKSNTPPPRPAPPRHAPSTGSPFHPEVSDSFPAGRKSPRNPHEAAPRNPHDAAPQPDPQRASLAWPMGFDDWGDDSILAAVLAQSQHEYYENLTRQNNNPNTNTREHSSNTREEYTNNNIPMDARNNYQGRQ